MNKNTTTSLSISSTACTDKDDAISYVVPFQHTPTSTDTFNLCYTPSSIISPDNNTPKAQISPISKPIKVIPNINSPFPNIETSKDMQSKTNDQQITITASLDNTDNTDNIPSTKSVKHKPSISKTRKSKRFSLSTGDVKAADPLLPKEEQTLLSKGYKRNKFVAKALQGEVFEAKIIKTDGTNNGNEEETVIIKTANKIWHQQGITITDKGKVCKISENIFCEAMIMKKLNENNPPNTMIKYYEFFWDEQQFYLVMEKGDDSLFEFVVDCHKLINCGKLRVREWRTNVRFIFGQMIEFIQWMHNDMGCCNMDISLENIVLTQNSYYFEPDKDGILSLRDCFIKFIDFGLTQQFNKGDNHFICNQFVGKTGYKSPQIYRRKLFRANKADIWSLGVCLFMMIIGAPPYQLPNASKDAAFKLIKNGKIEQLLIEWGRLRYITPYLHDLLSKMLCYDEEKRIDIDGVANHLWLQPYFKKNNNIKNNKINDNVICNKYYNQQCLINNKLNIMIPNKSISKINQEYRSNVVTKAVIIQSDTTINHEYNSCVAAIDDISCNKNGFTFNATKVKQQ